MEAIGPEVIVALGSVAAQHLLDVTTPIGRMRGRWHKYGDTRVMPTFHPAYLLRNPAEKRKVFEDMIMVRDALGIEPGPAGTSPETAGD